MSESSCTGLSRRSRRLFFAFLAASVAAHAAVLVGLSLPARESGPALPASLEVFILPAESLPAAAAEPAPQRQNLARTARAPETAPPRRAREQPEPVLMMLPEAPSADTGPDAAAADKPDAPRSPPVETLPSIPPLTRGGTKEGVATAAAAPPSVSAAYLSNPRPRYPDAARRAGEQGTVTLRVLVTREGLAARVQVEKSSGSAHLDRAALEAVKAWRFTPARQGAERIESWMLVPVVFRLEGSS